MKPRILVCGGRDFTDRDLLNQTLDALCVERGWTTEPDEHGNTLANVFVIGGKARGADTMAIDWAVDNWCEFQEYPADWQTHGKRAGYLRNVQMHEEGKPDVVVAFPGGRGTEMMIGIAVKAGTEVIKVTA